MDGDKSQVYFVSCAKAHMCTRRVCYRFQRRRNITFTNVPIILTIWHVSCTRRPIFIVMSKFGMCRNALEIFLAQVKQTNSHWSIKCSLYHLMIGNFSSFTTATHRFNYSTTRQAEKTATWAAAATADFIDLLWGQNMDNETIKWKWIYQRFHLMAASSNAPLILTKKARHKILTPMCVLHVCMKLYFFHSHSAKITVCYLAIL